MTCKMSHIVCSQEAQYVFFWEKKGGYIYALQWEEKEANRSFAFALSITGLTNLMDYFEDFEKNICGGCSY